MKENISKENISFYFGCWIYVDPDEELIELIELDLDINILCELLRCDATDLIELTEGLWGYVDGEGAWQERQTEWSFQGYSCWGPHADFPPFI